MVRRTLSDPTADGVSKPRLVFPTLPGLTVGRGTQSSTRNMAGDQSRESHREHSSDPHTCRCRAAQAFGSLGRRNLVATVTGASVNAPDWPHHRALQKLRNPHRLIVGHEWHTCTLC